MLTQAQIDQFRKQAREMGASELEIAEEISRKIKENAKSSLNPQSTQQDISQKEADIKPKKKNIIDKATSFLAPRTTTFSKDLKGVNELKNNVLTNDTKSASLQKRSLELAKLAQKETDPNKKQELILQSRLLAEEASSNYNQMSRDFTEKTGMDFNKDYLAQRGSYGSQALGVAGEIGSWLAPSFKILKGQGLVAKIVNSAATGAVSSSIYGFTTPEDISLDERGEIALKAGATGAVTSGIITGATSAIASPIKKFVKENNDRIYRLFRISPSARAQFRKSTQNMDFAEEIFSREGKSMAGKDYQGLLSLFSERKKEASKKLGETLANSKETISKKTIVDRTNELIKNLDPKKGNVGQEETIRTLKTLLKSIEKNPEELTMPVANNIKKQLQKMGESAFSPSGKATATSKQLANLSSYVKELIEGAVPESATHNRSIQLYDLAKRSIEKTGDAEVNKKSNDLIQKLTQILPGVGGVVGGVAVGAPSGNPIMGGFGGFLAGQILSGGLGLARASYFKPETQTNLISWVGEVAKKQGIKNAEKLAKSVVDQLGRVMTRDMFKGTPETEISDKQIGETPSTPSQDNLKLTQNPTRETGLVEIRNTETGEIRQVREEELVNYGLDNSPSNSFGIPKKEMILAAMFLDIQSTGGKNMSTLNTLLNAYDKIGDSSKLSANERASISEATVGLNLVGEIEDSYKELQSLGLTAKSGGLERIRGGLVGLSASISQEGTSGAAAAAYANTVEAFLSKISRATGEKGVLTDQDTKRIKKAIPSFSDSPEAAERQFNLIKTIISAAIEAKTHNPIGND